MARGARLADALPFPPCGGRWRCAATPDEGSRRKARCLRESRGLLAYAVEIATIREVRRQARFAARPLIRPRCARPPSPARGEGARAAMRAAVGMSARPRQRAPSTSWKPLLSEVPSPSRTRYAGRLRRSQTIDGGKTSEVHAAKRPMARWVTGRGEECSASTVVRARFARRKRRSRRRNSQARSIACHASPTTPRKRSRSGVGRSPSAFMSRSPPSMRRVSVPYGDRPYGDRALRGLTALRDRIHIVEYRAVRSFEGRQLCDTARAPFARRHGHQPTEIQLLSPSRPNNLFL